MKPTDLLYNASWIMFYLIFLAFFVFGILYSIASWIRKRKAKKQLYNLTFLQIKLPPDNEIEIKAAEHMFSNLMGFKKGFWRSLFSGEYRISFEIVSKQEGIGFYVVVPDDIVSIVEKQINAAYPSAEIDVVNPHEIWDRGEYTEVAELKLKGPAYYPIKVYEDLKNDSLSSITSAMTKLRDDEVVAVQYVIQPAPDSWRFAGRKYVSSTKARANDPEKKTNIDTGFLEAIEKKIAEPGFYTKIRLISIAKDKITAQNHISNLKSAFEQFTNIEYNRFILTKGWFSFIKRQIVDDFIYRSINFANVLIPILDIQLFLNAAVLNTIEMATVFHFPNKEIETPNIVWLQARRNAAPPNLPTSGELYLGKNVFRGQERKVYMNTDDRRRHFYIIGQTGTGKSVFMIHHLALQDIMAGNGVAVIDPHGADLEKLLEKIPPERLDDVIYFDAAEAERPMGLNLLEAHSEEEKHMIINAFIALLYKLYDPNRQGIMGPQLERAIRNVMLTAMAEPDSTMVDVLRMLIDEKYAKRFLSKVTDRMVIDYWEKEVANTSAQRKGETMGYFVSKFDRFVTDKTMRQIIGQPKSAFNFHDVMANKKILLVNLAKGKIGEENSNFLGLILIPRILSAALARHKLLGKEEFPDFFLYVDEFQNFATDDFATILSEARKYKLNLTVAHQFVAQLPDKIKDAMFGNVGTMCSFRVGAEDGEFLENYFGPTFTERDLTSLSVGNCYTRVLVKGHPTPAFSMLVDWDDITSYPKYPDMPAKIVELSKLRYGTPAHEVEEYINERLGHNEPEVPELPPASRPKLPF